MAHKLSSPPARVEHDVAGLPGLPSSNNPHQSSVGLVNAAKLHVLYLTEINDNEKIWRDRYTFLLGRGLELRPRYQPGWTPSWLGTTLDPAYCDDSIEQIVRPTYFHAICADLTASNIQASNGPGRQTT